MRPWGKVISLMLLLCVQLSWSAEPVTKLKADESATLFPALGWRDPAGDGWMIELHGWVYEREARKMPVAIMEELFGFKFHELTAEEKKIFDERTRWFLVDNQRGKKLYLDFAGQQLELPKTEANGHTEKLISILEQTCREQDIHAGTNVISLRLSKGDQRQVNAQVHLISETGWSVVSDIDDTIKVTEVRNKEALVKNTFCRPFKATDGMAAMYQRWAEQGAVFHYVSASPWQLYPDLESFRKDAGYPAGTFHLRELRLKDWSAIQFFAHAKHFKPEAIGGLFLRYPQRKFILVGDSGEHDPEIYGALARSHPDQVAKILIRNVTQEGANAERYQAAFQGVAKEKWNIFTHPDEAGNFPLIKLETK